MVRVNIVRLFCVLIWSSYFVGFCHSECVCNSKE